ncbi:hypothetical protein C443_00302 [Haloarcula argentinensis DSM 12282]|nr:hypothetical protein C443_00302 [Haloarcula argentinensis DSM 12282]
MSQSILADEPAELVTNPCEMGPPHRGQPQRWRPVVGVVEIPVTHQTASDRLVLGIAQITERTVLAPGPVLCQALILAVALVADTPTSVNDPLAHTRWSERINM